MTFNSSVLELVISSGGVSTPMIIKEITDPEAMVTFVTNDIVRDVLVMEAMLQSDIEATGELIRMLALLRLLRIPLRLTIPYFVDTF